MAKHRVTRLRSALIALCLAFAPISTGVNAADDGRKVGVV